MKRWIISIVALILTFVGTSVSYAQSDDFIVNVSAKSNPLPAQAAAYASTPGQFFNVTLTNMGSETADVRIEMRVVGPIEGGGDAWPSTSNSYIEVRADRPLKYFLMIGPGNSRTMTTSEINTMFSNYTSSEKYVGGDLSSTFDNVAGGAAGLLKEGRYGLKVTVKTNYTDQNDPGREVGSGFCFFDICYNASAPSFTNPTYTDNGDFLVTDLSHANSIFRWTEPTFNNTRLTTPRQFYYDFKIMRVENGKTPYEAAQNGAVAFQQKGLLTPSCNLSPVVISEMMRSGTDRFVAQVTARSMVSDASSAQYALVANEGKSELLVLNANNAGGGQDGNLVIPDQNGQYPIKVTIEPKYSEVTNWMEPYLKTPSDLFRVTLENTTNTKYKFSMLMQYFKGNWAICAAPENQYIDRYMEIGAYQTIELTDEDFDRLAGGYELGQAITFKAQTGFIIGPPTSEFFPDKDYKAAIRICEYKGDGTPVLRNRIIGKNRCDFITSSDVSVSDELKVSFEPKLSPMPFDPTAYFEQPSRLFKIKIKNLGTRGRNIKPILTYDVNESVYMGDKDWPLGESEYLYIGAGEEVELTAEQIDKYLGGMKEVDHHPSAGTKRTIEIADVEFSVESNANKAVLNLYDWNEYSANVLSGESVESALIKSSQIDFTASASVSLGRVDITITSALEKMPYYGFYYVQNPGRMFQIKIKNTTDETLRLKPYLTYRQKGGKDVNEEGLARYEYTPGNCAILDDIEDLVLGPLEEKVLTMEELDSRCGSTESAGQKAKAFKYDNTTHTGDFIEEFSEIISAELTNTVQFLLINSDKFEEHKDDDPSTYPDISEGRAVMEFKAYEDADLNIVDVIVKKRLEQMPCNSLPHFSMPGQLWDIELKNSLDIDLEVCLLPFYKFGETEGVHYSTRAFSTFKESDVIVLKAKETRKLTPDEINAVMSHTTAVRYREWAEGMIINDEIDLEDSWEAIEVSTLKDNYLDFYVLDTDIITPEGRQGKKLEDLTLGNAEVYWKAAEGVHLNPVSVTVKPKEKRLTGDAKAYFDSPGALFDISLQNNTKEKRKIAFSMSYLFNETGDYYSGTYPNRINECYFEIEPGVTKELTAEEINKMCAKPEKVYRYRELPDGELEGVEVTDFKGLVNLTSYNQIEVVAYDRDSLLNIPEADETRKKRAFLGSNQADFQASDNQKYAGIKVKIEPKKNVTFSKEVEDYFTKPADYFDVTLSNETTEEFKTGLRLTLNKRFYGADRPDTITIPAGKSIKLSAEQLNKLCGGYDLDGDIAEADSLGKLKGVADEDSIVMKNGVNMMTALLWKKFKYDNTEEEKFDSICAHDTIFTPAMSEIKIGEYVLTIEDATKIEGKDEEQNKLLNECYSGSGYITFEPLGFPIKLQVEWDTIYVNWKQGIVTKGKVKSKTNKESLMPEKLLDDDFINGLTDAQKEVYETQVKMVLEESNVSNYYNYVRKDMQYLSNLTSGDGVLLPVGIAFPMAEGGECPADIQLAKMEFTPEKATMDLLGQFTMPETDYLGTPTKNDDGTYKNNAEILMFGAQDLELAKDGFLPPSGAIGLLADFTIHDPKTQFDFTFVASSKRFEKATDGCYIAWENGEFKRLNATIQVNIPTDKIVSDADPTKPVNARLTAMIADASDWYGQITMDPFQVPDWPGYTFVLTGDTLSEGGIIYDHSPSMTPAGIKFHKAYNSEVAGLGTKVHPNESEKIYNQWQGFYWEKLSVKFPHFVEINDNEDKRLALDFTMMYDNKFSGGLVASNIIDKRTGKAGGWGISIDTVSLDIVQGDFYGAGFQGELEVPLLTKKNSSGESEKARLGYRADIFSIAKSEKSEGGTGVTFKIQQVDNEVSMDFMLAEATLEKSKTWFKIDYNDTRAKDKQTFVELMLGGNVNISCTEKIGFTLPNIPFSNMRLANCTPEEMKEAEEAARLRGQAPKEEQNQQQQSTQSTAESVTNGKDHFSMGDWNYSANDNQPDSQKSDFGGFDISLEKISPKFGGDKLDELGVYVQGKISILGGKNNGISTTVGLTILSTLDWTKKEIKYKKTQFNDLSVQGAFGGVVELNGSLEVKDEEDKSGFGTKEGEEFKIKVKGLFEAQLAGAYYKVKKTEDDFKADGDDEEAKKDSVFHAGYFTTKVSTNIPMGLVSLNSLAGGLFINYGTNADGQGADESFVDAVSRNAKIRYKSYGGFFGLGLSVVKEEMIKGDANLMIMLDMSGEKCKVHDFHIQGNIHALCAPDSDNGLVNGRVDIIYTDNVTPDDPESCKRFNLNITASAKIDAVDKIKDVTGVDFEKIASNFLDKDFEVPDALANLTEFDQKNADPENQGEGTDTSDKTSSAEKNGLKANVGMEITMSFETRTFADNKTKWHLYIGEPDEEKRCRITFIDFEVGKDKPIGLWAKAYANMYLCLGNELPNDGMLPELPEKVQEALGFKKDSVEAATNPSEFQQKLKQAQDETLAGVKGEIDGGIMIGAAVGAEFGCNAVFCYAALEGMAGFDLVLKKFAKGERCRGGQLKGGKNGFYATGQMYAYLSGEVGLMLDLWIYKGKIPLADLTLAALLKAGFPNPTWAYGRLRAKGSVLGGLVKFESAIEMKMGNVCLPDFGNPLDDIKIFGDVTPGDDEFTDGWSQNKIASAYVSPTFTTNMKIGKHLALIDEGKTAERATSGSESSGEASASIEGAVSGGTNNAGNSSDLYGKVDENTYLRTYVFLLGDEDQNVPKFKMYTHTDSTTNKGGTLLKEVGISNPSADKENFTIDVPSLKQNTLYSIELVGYAKEVVNGRLVDPVFNDEKSGWEDEEREWTQKTTLYFRTGNYSDKMADNVAAFFPAHSSSASPWASTLEDAADPRIVMGVDYADYFEDSNYEFVASVKHIQRKTVNGVLTDVESWPDASGGLIAGQKSLFDRQPVMLYEEKGVDEYGDAFHFQTLKFKKPLPEQYFKQCSANQFYRYELYRINRKLMTQHINLIEEKYKSIMALTDEERTKFEEELEAMNTKDDADPQTTQIMKDLYDYYKEVESKYGENEVEQRMMEYKDQFASNTEAYADLVYTKDYHYNGVASFQDYMKKYAASSTSAFSPTSFTWAKGTYSVGMAYRYDKRLSDLDETYPTISYSLDNNPYKRMAWWFRYNCWSRDLVTYDLCSYRGAAYLAKGRFEFEPSYPQFRPTTANASKIPNVSGSDDNLAFYEAYDPVNAKNYAKTRWHYTKAVKIGLGETFAGNIVKELSDIYQKDAQVVGSFEYVAKFYWNLIVGKGKAYNTLTSSQKTIFKTIVNTSVNSPIPICSVVDSATYGKITMPLTQYAYIVAKDAGNLGLGKRNSGLYEIYSKGTAASKTWDPTAFTNHIKGYECTVKYFDGYNLESATYDVRPEKGPKHAFKMQMRMTKFGDKPTANQVTIVADESVNIPDEKFREYLLKNFDKDKDGKLVLSELHAIKSIEAHGKSFTGLEYMVNLETFSMSNYIWEKEEGGYGYRRAEEYDLHLSELPKLTTVNIYNTILGHLDLRNCPNLTTVNIDRSYVIPEFDDGSNVTTFKHTNRALPSSVGGGAFYYPQDNVVYDLTMLKKLTTLDMIGDDVSVQNSCEKQVSYGQRYDANKRQMVSDGVLHNALVATDTIDIRGLANINWANSGFGSKFHKYVYVKADNTPTVMSYLYPSSSANYKQKNWNVQLMTTSVSEALLDQGLYKCLQKHVTKQKFKSNYIEDYRAIKVLNASGYGIKTIKYLDYFCPNLEELYIDNNSLKELDVAAFKNLKVVVANNNEMGRIVVPYNSEITTLNVDNNMLASIPTDNLKNLTTLKCANNHLGILYVNELTSLEHLDCSNNNLEQLVMTGLRNLRSVVCSNNQFLIGELRFPTTSPNLKYIEANKCLQAGAEGTTTGFTLNNLPLERLYISDNSAIRGISADMSKIKTIVVRNCALESGSIINLASSSATLDTVDVSGNPKLKSIINYDSSKYPNLKYINYTGCNIQNKVNITGTVKNDLQLRVGVPQRLVDYKVIVNIPNFTWLSRWEEWKNYVENQHTTIVYVKGQKLYKEESEYLEEITEEDLKLKAALGENAYNAWKEKYAPKKRALHTEDVAKLTDVDLSNPKVAKLDSVLHFTPKVKNLVVGGYNIIKLPSMLSELQYFKIADNGILDTLVIPNALSKNLKTVEVVNTPISSIHWPQTLTASDNVIMTNIGRVSDGYDYFYTNSPNTRCIRVNGANVRFWIRDIMNGNCDTISLSNIREFDLKGNNDVSKNVPIPYVALSDSFKVTAGNARIEQLYVSNWTNPSDASLAALVKAVRVSMTIDGIPASASPLNLTSTKTSNTNLTLANVNTDVILGSGGFVLSASNSSLVFPVDYGSYAKQLSSLTLTGDNKLTFKSADMLLKWLYIWRPESPGANVTLAAASDDPSKQTMVALVNAELEKGTLDVDKYAERDILTAIHGLVQKGWIPAGDAYYDVLKEIDAEFSNQVKNPTGEYSVRLLNAEYVTVAMKKLKEVLDITLSEGRDFAQSAPCIIVENTTQERAQEIVAAINATNGMSAEVVAPATQQAQSTPVARPRVIVTYIYNVGLASVGSNTLKVIKVVREMTGLSLTNAKKLVGTAPCVVAEGLTLAQANEFKTALEEVGATVTLTRVVSGRSSTTTVTTPSRLAL